MRNCMYLCNLNVFTLICNLHFSPEIFMHIFWLIDIEFHRDVLLHICVHICAILYFLCNCIYFFRTQYNIDAHKHARTLTPMSARTHTYYPYEHL
jgi:hypothetical protein